MIYTELDVEQLKDTGCYERLKNLQVFYDYVNNFLSEFDERENIRCIEACGECCKHYLPDLTIVEAEYIALYLIQTGRVEEFFSRCEKDINYCPMFNEDSNYHCSIYPARGLICRLFGSACTLDKNGRAIKPACRWKDEEKTETIDATDDIPISSKLGAELENINGGNMETEPFNQAVSKAIMKLEMLLAYSGNRAQ